MRRLLLIGALLALGACQREKSFDERYADAEKSIRATAAAIDKDLAEQLPSSPSAQPEALEGHAQTDDPGA